MSCHTTIPDHLFIYLSIYRSIGNEQFIHSSINLSARELLELGLGSELGKDELIGLRELRGHAVGVETLLGRLEGGTNKHLRAEGHAGVGAPLEEDGLGELRALGAHVQDIDNNEAGILGVVLDDGVDEGLPDEGVVGLGVDIEAAASGVRELVSDIDGLALDLEDEVPRKVLLLVAANSLVSLGKEVVAVLSVLGDVEILK